MPESTLNIREAAAEDVETLVALRFAFLQAFHPVDGEKAARLEPELRGYFARRLGRPGFVALLGFVGEEAVCTAFLTIGECPPSPQFPNGRVGTVFNVYTAENKRKKGYARLVMQQLVAWAHRRGVAAINLNASPAGVPLYQSLGFAKVENPSMRLLLP